MAREGTQQVAFLRARGGQRARAGCREEGRALIFKHWVAAVQLEAEHSMLISSQLQHSPGLGA